MAEGSPNPAVPGDHQFAPIEVSPALAAQIRSALGAAALVAFSLVCLIYPSSGAVVPPGQQSPGVVEITSLAVWGITRLTGLVVGPIGFFRAFALITSRVILRPEGIRYRNLFHGWTAGWEEVFFFHASPRALEIRSRRRKISLGGGHPLAETESIVSAVRPLLAPGALVEEGELRGWGRLAPLYRALIVIGSVLAAYEIFNLLFLWLRP